MAAFNGKWCLVSAENLEAYHDALKTPAEHKDKMKQLAASMKADPGCHVHEICVDPAAGTIKHIISFKGEKKHELEAKLGEEREITTACGRKAKVKLTLDGNKLCRCEKGDGYESTGCSEVSGNEMTVTQTCGGVSSVQKFKKQ